MMSLSQKTLCLITIFVTLILISCLSAPAQIPTEIVRPTDTLFTISATNTPEPKLTTTATARIFAEPINCDQTLVQGHILFVRQGENDGLYIMDGHACYQHLIMQDASGSPDWSVDGQRISTGCENNKYICILDATATLASCLKSNDSTVQCRPVIIDKYSLPQRQEQMQIYNTSWSADGNKIIVESGDYGCWNCYVDILTLTENGTWETLIEGVKLVHPDMSPIRDEIVFSGIYIMPLDDKPLQTYVGGYDAVWSQDGNKIAFLINTHQENKEPTAIWVWDFTVEKHVHALYEPPNLDMHYWPPQNLRFGDDSGNYRVLSWSPDGRYLAFVAGRAMYDNQIFRLDTKTGEIVLLTDRLGDYGYIAPAWGP